MIAGRHFGGRSPKEEGDEDRDNKLLRPGNTPSDHPKKLARRTVSSNRKAGGNVNE
ncbi:MAG: hypothetical protein IT539_05810 [Bradyrhizobiaceae bacterium]|nr:hypothetical protein [Bradyrhizobiaceae bacterium]